MFHKLRYETKKSVSDGVDEIGGDAHYAAAAAQGQAPPGAALEFNEHRNNSTKFRRPLLIINHNAKAGGGSILETIREFKSCEIKAKVNGNAIRDILVQQEQEKNRSQTFNDNDCFVHIKESRGSTYEDRQYGFIIGSIREPCSHLLSWWSWKSKGGGGLNKIREQMGSHQFQSLLGTNRGGNNPYYNSTSDIQKFQQWIQYPSPMSEQIEYQFRHNYYYGISQHPTTTTGNAAGLDCWVIIEDFSNSLLHCLYMYENQGGFVDWTSSLVAGLVQKKIQEEGEENNNNNTHHHRSLFQQQHQHQHQHQQQQQQQQHQQKKKKKKIGDKNNPLSNPQLKHHTACIDYFNPEIAKQVEDGSSKVIYDHFGYIGCCSKEFNRSTIYGDDYNDNDNRDDKY